MISTKNATCHDKIKNNHNLKSLKVQWSFKTKMKALEIQYY